MTSARVLVLAGGQSDEHAISLLSARSVLHALEQTPFHTQPILIARDGRWLSLEASQEHLRHREIVRGELSCLEAARFLNDFDVVLPILHGPFGEDGTLQGMLQLSGLPYVGSGVLGSALCMDKPMSKDVLAQHGFSQVPYALVWKDEWVERRDACLARLTETLQAPYFVKPANLGSSIGISKAHTTQELISALEHAAHYDRRLVVEQALKGARELEVALIGNDQVEASPVGEIRYQATFYDYETKYTEGCSTTHIPADLPESVSKEIQTEAIRAFRTLDCSGFARIDYFYDPGDQKIYLNEVNTIPGFTPHSMFTKLWEHAGLSYPAVIEKLIRLALEKHGKRPHPRA